VCALLSPALDLVCTMERNISPQKREPVDGQNGSPARDRKNSFPIESVTKKIFRLPLSDKHMSLGAAIKLISNAQTREKSLKILQYTCKLLAYALVRRWKDASHSMRRWRTGKHCEALAKNLSTARRFFKFMRWLKHFEDIAEAKTEKTSAFRQLLYVDVACNIVADISEDVTSLEKLGILRKGTLPKRTEYYSNWCQLGLAVVEIAVSAVKAKRWREVSGPEEPLSQRRKRAMADLELSKYAADLIKAFWDCELSFASEFAFCCAGLWAALISTHKYALKVLK